MKWLIGKADKRPNQIKLQFNKYKTRRELRKQWGIAAQNIVNVNIRTITKKIARDGDGHECHQVDDDAEEHSDKKKCMGVRIDGSKDIMGF